MDELTLLGHLAGGGEALVDRLRATGLTDLAALHEKSPDVLAKELAVSDEEAQKIITAARAIRKVEPARPTKREKREEAKSKEAKPKVENAIAAAEQAISRVIKRTPKRTAARARGVSGKRVPRRRYAKALFPILGLVLIGAMLRNQG